MRSKLRARCVAMADENIYDFCLHCNEPLMLVDGDWVDGYSDVICIPASERADGQDLLHAPANHE